MHIFRDALQTVIEEQKSRCKWMSAILYYFILETNYLFQTPNKMNLTRNLPQCVNDMCIINFLGEHAKT